MRVCARTCVYGWTDGRETDVCRAARVNRGVEVGRVGVGVRKGKVSEVKSRDESCVCVCLRCAGRLRVPWAVRACVRDARCAVGVYR